MRLKKIKQQFTISRIFFLSKIYRYFKRKKPFVLCLLSWSYKFPPKAVLISLSSLISLNKSSYFFNGDFYLKKYPDVRKSGINPLLHFITYGGFEARNPSVNFDSSYYLRNNPDVAQSKLNPLVHFIKYGITEGRIPKPPGGYSHIISSNHRRFSNYSEYLVHSFIAPDIMRAPFSQEDLRVLGIMDWHKKQLAKSYAGAPQDILVSVIMPTFNRSNVIARAIESVINQSYRNWELIIIDDSSTDNTDRVVKNFHDSRIYYHRLDKNSGASSARNIGLAKSRGRYICYLDSDDIWDEDFILISLNKLSDTRGSLSIYSAQKLWDCSRGFNEKQLTGVRFALFNRSLLENNNYISGISFMHDRILLQKYGFFRDDMKALTDWEIFLRFTKYNFPIALPVILSHYLRNLADNQITRTEDRNKSLMLISETLNDNSSVSGKLKDLSPLKSVNLFGAGSKRETKYNRKVSIIIPNFEALEYLQACVESIRNFTAEGQYDIIIVDNASSNPVQSYLKHLSKDPNATILYNHENLGFSYAVNLGIEAADPGSDIIILNNDALVTPGWLPALQEVVETVKDAGIIVPRQTLPANDKTIKTHVPGSNAHREMDTSLSAHHRNIIDPAFDTEKGFVELSFAPFFCVYITREVFNEVGYLDVENGPHYRSDWLYCDKVRTFAKRRIIYTPHSKLYHFLMRSTEALKNADASAYNHLCVRNNWNEIRNSEIEPGCKPLRRNNHRSRVVIRRNSNLAKTSFRDSSVVFISGVPKDSSHLYRVSHQVRALNESGFRAYWYPGYGISGRRDDIISADAVVLSRLLWSDEIDDLVKECRNQGGKIIFEIDDLLFDPDFASDKYVDSLRLADEHHRDIWVSMIPLYRETLIHSDYCILPTGHLAARCRGLGKKSYVLKNGFDEMQLALSNIALWSRFQGHSSDIIRIGYASGSLTHQRDFSIIINPLERILKENTNTLLTIVGDFRINEFNALRKYSNRIEIRQKVPYRDLPAEYARFDINLAPLEIGNPFCESKSEIKYVESALLKVPTVASATGAFCEAIESGKNGFTARDDEEWHKGLVRLIKDHSLRRFIGETARKHVETEYGPLKRQNHVSDIFEEILS